MSVIDTPAAAVAALRSNGTPVYYVSTTPWNALGLCHWVENLHFLCATNPFDGSLRRFATASACEPRDWDTFEAMNNRLLGDPDIRRYVRAHGVGGLALFLMFDEANEAAARAAGLTVGLPPAALRTRIDDKIATTRIGDEAGVRSVPNVLGRVDGYATLRRLAENLGPELVVQLPFGDSGRTTFFISSEADYARHAGDIEAEREVKIMRRIRCRQAAIEACVTRRGTAVGPLLTEMVGFPELTPHRAGWCGNELARGAFATGIVDDAADVTRRFGDRLAALGYRGVFGLDFLIDEDGGDLYLGEMNPRITGATPMSTQAARELDCPPLLLLHLLEWLDVPHAFDLAAINDRFRRLDGARAWSQLVIKEIREGVPPVRDAPPGGVWQLAADGGATRAKLSVDTGDIAGESQALVAHTVGRGVARDRGTVIARVMTEGRLMTPRYELEPRARAWTRAVREAFD